MKFRKEFKIAMLLIASVVLTLAISFGNDTTYYPLLGLIILVLMLIAFKLEEKL